MASTIPHLIESRSSMQKRVGEEMINIFNSFVLKADSEAGLEELGEFLEEEEDFEIFLEVVAPLMRVNYEVHANILENKILNWIPQYEVFAIYVKIIELLSKYFSN